MDPACPVQPALNARSESPTGLQSHGPEPEASQTPLVAALLLQVEAINRLAASNEAMTQAIGSLIEEMGKEEEEQGDDPVGYLNARARS